MVEEETEMLPIESTQLISIQYQVYIQYTGPGQMPDILLIVPSKRPLAKKTPIDTMVCTKGDKEEEARLAGGQKFLRESEQIVRAEVGNAVFST